MDKPKTPVEETRGVGAKKPYSPPQLVRYGTIEELTELKFGTQEDVSEVSQSF